MNIHDVTVGSSVIFHFHFEWDTEIFWKAQNVFVMFAGSEPAQINSASYVLDRNESRDASASASARWGSEKKQRIFRCRED